MSDENKHTAEDTRAHLHALAQVLNSIAGVPKTFEVGTYYEHGGHLTSKDGGGFFLRYSNIWLPEEGRAQITGDWPKDTRYSGNCTMSPRDVNEYAPGTTFAMSKTINAQASDIARRFWPDYARIWAKMQEKLEEGRRYNEKRDANMNAIIEATGWSRERLNADGDTLHFYGPPGGQVDVYSDSVSLRVTGLTPEQTVAICKIIVNQGGRT